MSSYVVKDVTINKVVSFLYAKHVADNFYWPSRILAEAGYDMGKSEDCARLATDMFNLNVRATDDRYGEGEAAQFRPLDFEYRFVTPPPIIAIYSSLQCWRYQCVEGEIPQEPLFKLMSQIWDFLAHRIVQDTQSYKNSRWE